MRGVSFTFAEWEAHLENEPRGISFQDPGLGDVPHSRNGKHKLIVSMIPRDLDQLKNGAALECLWPN